MSTAVPLINTVDADLNALRAFVATHFLPASKRGHGEMDVLPISYAVILIGPNFRKTLWGFGYVTFEDAGRGAALRHAEEYRVAGQKLIGFGRGLLSHVGATGTVHSAIPSGLTASGKPYDAYDWLAPIAMDIKDGSSIWNDVGKRGTSEFSKALAMAAGEPWKRAEAYRPHFAHYLAENPRNHIIGRDDNPDPLGLMKD